MDYKICHATSAKPRVKIIKRRFKYGAKSYAEEYKKEEEIKKRVKLMLLK